MSSRLDVLANEMEAAPLKDIPDHCMRQLRQVSHICIQFVGQMKRLKTHFKSQDRMNRVPEQAEEPQCDLNTSDSSGQNPFTSADLGDIMEFDKVDTGSSIFAPERNGNVG